MFGWLLGPAPKPTPPPEGPCIIGPNGKKYRIIRKTFGDGREVFEPQYWDDRWQVHAHSWQEMWPSEQFYTLEKAQQELNTYFEKTLPRITIAKIDVVQPQPSISPSIAEGQ